MRCSFSQSEADGLFALLLGWSLNIVFLEETCLLPNNVQPMERVLVSVVLFLCLVFGIFGEERQFLYVAPEIVSKGLDEDPGSAKSKCVCALTLMFISVIFSPFNFLKVPSIDSQNIPSPSS